MGLIDSLVDKVEAAVTDEKVEQAGTTADTKAKEAIDQGTQKLEQADVKTKAGELVEGLGAKVGALTGNEKIGQTITGARDDVEKAVEDGIAKLKTDDVKAKAGEAIDKVEEMAKSFFGKDEEPAAAAAPAPAGDKKPEAKE